MQYLALFIIMAVLAIYVIKRIREQFLETSYYYEAAPGARGSRLICMPEARGTASLGIDVNSAASKAVNSCAPLTMTYKPKKKKRTIPKMCLQYMGTRKPVRPVLLPATCPRGTKWNGSKCVRKTNYIYSDARVVTRPNRMYVSGAAAPSRSGAPCPRGLKWDGKRCRPPSARSPSRTSPGCGQGLVWDGKKCKVPSAAAAAVRTSRGCSRGMIWDGKKCRLPGALRAALQDPSRPRTPLKKKGKSIANPNGKVKWRKVKGGTFPFMQINGKWVQVEKKNNKWVVINVSKSKKAKKSCGKGKIWDGKKCRKPRSA